MKTKIKDYLQLIIAFSVGIALFLFLRPFIQLLLNKFIASMTSSQIGRFVIIIIGFGALVLGGYLVYSMLTYITGKKERTEDDKNGI
jgi:hypothetical protein